MLSGDNGILQRATQSKEKTERAEIIENAQMDILAKITDKKGGNITEDELVEILTSSNYNTQGRLSSEESVLDRTLTSKNEKYTIPVSEIYNGSIKESEKIRTALDLKEGDRILYNSSIGDIECIVLYDSDGANYSETGIQMVSAEPLGENVELGNGTGSETESSNSNHFNISKTSYDNSITNLNSIAENFRKKDDTDITQKARCLGTNIDGSNNDTLSWHISDVEASNNDFLKINSLGLNDIDNYYWFAQKMYESYVDSWYRGLLKINKENVIFAPLYGYSSTSWGDEASRSYSYKIRPVFILKENVKIKSGTGVSGDSYILEL